MTKNTSLGAIKEDRVMLFSGKGPGLVLEIATMTKQSPEGTAFTLPLYHPVAPLAADAILQRSTTKTKPQHNQNDFQPHSKQKFRNITSSHLSAPEIKLLQHKKNQIQKQKKKKTCQDSFHHMLRGFLISSNFENECTK